MQVYRTGPAQGQAPRPRERNKDTADRQLHGDRGNTQDKHVADASWIIEVDHIKWSFY